MECYPVRCECIDMFEYEILNWKYLFCLHVNTTLFSYTSPLRLFIFWFPSGNGTVFRQEEQKYIFLANQNEESCFSTFIQLENFNWRLATISVELDEKWPVIRFLVNWTSHCLIKITQVVFKSNYWFLVMSLNKYCFVSIVTRFTWFCCEWKFSGHVVFVVSGNTAFWLVSQLAKPCGPRESINGIHLRLVYIHTHARQTR